MFKSYRVNSNTYPGTTSSLTGLWKYYGSGWYSSLLVATMMIVYNKHNSLTDQNVSKLRTSTQKMLKLYQFGECLYQESSTNCFYSRKPYLGKQTRYRSTERYSLSMSWKPWQNSLSKVEVVRLGTGWTTTPFIRTKDNSGTPWDRDGTYMGTL